MRLDRIEVDVARAVEEVNHDSARLRPN
jgi:hypothetical protein